METQIRDDVKKIIMAELPGLMERDAEVRRFILSVTRKRYADREETQSRFDRIMDELQQNRETSMRRWEAQEKKWDAQEKKWNAQEEKWETWEKKWDQERKDQQEKWKAQEKRWENWEKKWDQEQKIRDKRWADNQRVINDMLADIRKQNQRHNSSIGALGARWGLQSEAAFRNGLRAILEGSFGVKVERYLDFDHEGSVFGRPDQVELDVIVHNGTLILCEIKSSMSKSELYIFWRKKNYYETKHGRGVDRTMVISPMIDDRARTVAQELDIEMYGYAEDVGL